jgi:predicted PurR-regulated permease PerM
MLAHVDRPTFTRLMVTLAAGTIVLAGMKAAAELVNIVVMALFFGIVLMPLYRRLLRRTGKTGWAIGILFLLVLAFGLAMGAFLLYSAGQLMASLGDYGAGLGKQMASTAAGLEASGAGALSGLLAMLDPARVIALLAGLATTLISAVLNAGVALFIMLFFLAEAPALGARLRASLGAAHPLVARTGRYGESMITYFLVRTKLNLITGIGITVILWLLGVDFALLWGVLAFFLSYIPYIGLILATIPGMVLAFAEYGLGRALLVVVGIVLWNMLIENVFQPAITGRELSLSPAFVFVMFLLWTWLLGPVGAFLAMPITVAAVLAMDLFDDSRWLAALCGMTAEQERAPAAGQEEGEMT